MDIRVLLIPETGYAANCYIIFSEETKKAIIIDPASEIKVIMDNIEKNNLEPEKIVLTHGHADHIRVVKQLKEELDLPVYVHKGDQPMLLDPSYNFSSQMYGENIEIQADRLLEDGDVIELAANKIRVIHTPGHSEGGICLYFDDFLITGDTLFQSSIGRTDFPGGNFKDIISSIKEKILVLPEDTIILPGHGGQSTVGIEKETNPFLR